MPISRTEGRTMKRFFLILLLCAVCLLAACGGDDIPSDRTRPDSSVAEDSTLPGSGSEDDPLSTDAPVGTTDEGDSTAAEDTTHGEGETLAPPEEDGRETIEDTLPAPSVTEEETQLQKQPPYVVTVVCSLHEGVTLTGGDTVQTLTAAADFAPLSVTVGADFCYNGYEIGGVVYRDSVIRLPEGELTDDVTVTVLVSYLTEDLPVVSVHTNGVSVDSKEYVDMTLSLTNTEDIMLDVPGSIRLRGNSTYGFPKKPYRIKLEQKHSFFGLDKAKSWVLLADWLDPSTLHNYAALTLAGTSENFDFVPTPYKVNLYLNGTYQGVYTLCEQVQEQAGRLDLEMEIKRSMGKLEDYNFLICMNHNAPQKPNAEEGVTYFYLSCVDRYFELEYPTREDFPTEAQFHRFFTSLEDYMRETAMAFLASDRAYITQNVDVDSLIDLFLVDQIMGERDHHWKSVFMSYRGAEGDAKLSFGPPWDYDFCMFTQWTGEPNEEFELSNDFNPAEAAFFYRPLLENAYFTRKVASRYKNHFSDAITETIAAVEAQAAAMGESLELNQDRWYDHLPGITEDNVDFFIRYLKNRKAVLDRKWG